MHLWNRLTRRRIEPFGITIEVTQSSSAHDDEALRVEQPKVVSTMIIQETDYASLIRPAMTDKRAENRYAMTGARTQDVVSNERYPTNLIT